VLHDLFARRVRISVKQRGRLHNLPRLAIAALRNLLGNPGLLQGMVAVGRQAFDCRNLGARDKRQRRSAGSHGLAVKMHRARPAETAAAAVFGPGQAEVISQRPEYRRVGISIDRDRLAIDTEFDHIAYPPLNDLQTRPLGQFPIRPWANGKPRRDRLAVRICAGAGQKGA